MRFADKLRKERESLGLKQKEMALKLNLPTNTYNGYETGKRTPSLDVTAHIADALGVSVDYLLGRTTKNSVNATEKNKESFNNAQDALSFILKQPSIMAFGVPELSDEEIIDFANDILEHIQYISYKHKIKHKDK